MTPTQAEITLTFELEETWRLAFRKTLGLPLLRSFFSSQTPWLSPDKKQQRRFRTYCKTAVGLLKDKINPEEFCVAIAEHHKRFPRRMIKGLPSLQSMSGPRGRVIYSQWRESRLAEGGYYPGRLRAATATGIQTPKEEVAAQVRRAYEVCEIEGLDWGFSCSVFGPEITWLFYTTEPKSRATIQEQLQELKRQDPSRYMAFVIAYRTIPLQRKVQLTKIKTQLGRNKRLPTREEVEIANAKMSSAERRQLSAQLFAEQWR